MPCLRRSALALPFSTLVALVTYACGGVIESAPSDPVVVTEAGAPEPAPIRPDAARPEVDAAPPPRPPLPPRTEATEVDLGEVEPGAQVTLAVPPNALGFNVVVRGGARDLVGVDTIRSPSGEVVLAGHKVVGGQFETSLGELGIAAASVPQNRQASAAPVEPGVWSIQVSGPLGKKLKVAARVQLSGDGVFRGGAADLHVYLPVGLRIDDPTPAHVVSAANAAADRAIEARLAAFFEGLERNFGITRGAVTFHDTDAAYLNIATESALARAFAVSSSLPDGGQALHVLFTNGLDFGDGTWGIASGIPGAATRTGTPMSGVTLALTRETPADLDGLALLHEVGHFIGLNHTTEFQGSFVDPLADTPSCAGILDIEKPRTINDCPDKDNLMFPTLWSDTITVTESQKIIFRGSPTYRAFVGAASPEAGAPPDAAVPPEPPAPPDPARPGIGRTLRLTRSGRALTPSERFVFGGLCGGTPLDFKRLSTHLGVRVAHAELARMADDHDLPGVLRMRAGKMLARAGTRP